MLYLLCLVHCSSRWDTADTESKYPLHRTHSCQTVLFLCTKPTVVGKLSSSAQNPQLSDTSFPLHKTHSCPTVLFLCTEPTVVRKFSSSAQNPLLSEVLFLCTEPKLSKRSLSLHRTQSCQKFSLKPRVNQNIDLHASLAARLPLLPSRLIQLHFCSILSKLKAKTPYKGFAESQGRHT